MNKEVGPQIVVVEDEPHIRASVRIALTSSGYRVLEAATATDGIRQVTTDPPDVVLLDLGLPDLDGLDVIRLLRKSSSVPILVLSGSDEEVRKVAALDAGADDYLTKPFVAGE